MKLTFCVYGLVIVEWNNFLYDFMNHEIDISSFKKIRGRNQIGYTFCLRNE
jgi:hypothetical protein